MDKMFIKYKDEFIASMNATIDMMQNSLDTLDIKKQHGEEIDEESYNKTKKNIEELNRILMTYKINGVIAKEDEAAVVAAVVAAMGTVVVHMEFLAESYKTAAEKAKIIIANIKSDS